LQEIRELANGLLRQGPRPTAISPKKLKERLPQTFCSLSNNFLNVLHKWHYPRVLAASTRGHPGLCEQENPLRLTRTWCGLFLYSLAARL